MTKEPNQQIKGCRRNGSQDKWPWSTGLILSVSRWSHVTHMLPKRRINLNLINWEHFSRLYYIIFSFPLSAADQWFLFCLQKWTNCFDSFLSPNVWSNRFLNWSLVLLLLLRSVLIIGADIKPILTLSRWIYIRASISVLLGCRTHFLRLLWVRWAQGGKRCPERKANKDETLLCFSTVHFLSIWYLNFNTWIKFWREGSLKEGEVEYIVMEKQWETGMGIKWEKWGEWGNMVSDS